MKRSRVLKSTAVAVLVCFFGQHAAIAAEFRASYLPYAQAPGITNPHTAVSAVAAFPDSVGTIEDSFSASSPDTKTIFLIHDAHTNASGQFNIARAIQILIKEKNIRHVFLEAGTGDDSLGRFKSAVTPERRRSSGEVMVRKGVLQGAEFANLTSERDFTLWGVEDPELYRQSLELYRRVTAARPSARPYLTKIRTTLEYLRARILNPSLAELDAARRDHAEERLSAKAYSRRLMDAARGLNLPLERYPHLTVIRRLEAREARLDWGLVRREQRQAVDSLDAAAREVVDLDSPLEGDWNAVIGRAFALKDALRDNGINARAPQFPNLYKYFDYLRLCARLDAPAAIREQDLLEAAVIDGLARSAAEKRFITVEREFEAIQKLTDLKLTPATVVAPDLDRVTGYLNRQILELGTGYERALLTDAKADRSVRDAWKFYRLTIRRDQRFVERLTARMIAAGESEAALVAGGYHMPHLKALLKARGIGYVSILPRVTHPTDFARYEKLLLDQNPTQIFPAATAASARGPAASSARRSGIALIPAAQNPARLAQIAEALGSAPTPDLPAPGTQAARLATEEELNIQEALSGLINAALHRETGGLTGIQSVTVDQVLNPQDALPALPPGQQDYAKHTDLILAHTTAAHGVHRWLNDQGAEASFTKDRADREATYQLSRSYRMLDWLVGHVETGEGERDEVGGEGMIPIGLVVNVGAQPGAAPNTSIAQDVLEVTNGVTKRDFIGSGSLAVYAPYGDLKNLPDLYLYKWVVGPSAASADISTAADVSVRENLTRIAAAQDRRIEDLRGAILLRPAHIRMIVEMVESGIFVNGDADFKGLIQAFREANPSDAQTPIHLDAQSRLKSAYKNIETRAKKHGFIRFGNLTLMADGDFAPVFGLALPLEDPNHIDFLTGRGGAPEGVMTAAAARAIGGKMSATLVSHHALKEGAWSADLARDGKNFSEAELERLNDVFHIPSEAAETGLETVHAIYSETDLVRSLNLAVVFSAVKDNPWLSNLTGTRYNDADGTFEASTVFASPAGGLKIVRIVFETEVSRLRKNLQARPKGKTKAQKQNYTAILHKNLGRALLKYQEFDQAIEQFKLAREIYQPLGAEHDAQMMEGAIQHVYAIRALLTGVDENDSPITEGVMDDAMRLLDQALKITPDQRMPGLVTERLFHEMALYLADQKLSRVDKLDDNDDRDEKIRLLKQALSYFQSYLRRHATDKRITDQMREIQVVLNRLDPPAAARLAEKGITFAASIPWVRPDNGSGLFQVNVVLDSGEKAHQSGRFYLHYGIRGSTGEWHTVPAQITVVPEAKSGTYSLTATIDPLMPGDYVYEATFVWKPNDPELRDAKENWVWQSGVGRNAIGHNAAIHLNLDARQAIRSAEEDGALILAALRSPVPQETRPLLRGRSLPYLEKITAVLLIALQDQKFPLPAEARSRTLFFLHDLFDKEDDYFGLSSYWYSYDPEVRDMLARLLPAQETYPDSWRERSTLFWRLTVTSIQQRLSDTWMPVFKRQIAEVPLRLADPTVQTTAQSDARFDFVHGVAADLPSRTTGRQAVLNAAVRINNSNGQPVPAFRAGTVLRQTAAGSEPTIQISTGYFDVLKPLKESGRRHPYHAIKNFNHTYSLEASPLPVLDIQSKYALGALDLVLELAGSDREVLRREGRSLEIVVDSFLPERTGLGGSVTLGATLIASLAKAFGLPDFSDGDLAVLGTLLEARLGDLGGWQDGHLAKGLRFLEMLPGGTTAGTELVNRVNDLSDHAVVAAGRLLEEIQDRGILFLTFPHRSIHTLKRLVAGNLRANAAYVEQVRAAEDDLRAAWDALEAGALDLNALLPLIQNQANQFEAVSAGFVLPQMLQLVRKMEAEDLIGGWKPVGAGAGGFAIFFAKSIPGEDSSEVDRRRARIIEILNEARSLFRSGDTTIGSNVYPFTIRPSEVPGLEVSQGPAAPAVAARLAAAGDFESRLREFIGRAAAALALSAGTRAAFAMEMPAGAAQRFRIDSASSRARAASVHAVGLVSAARLAVNDVLEQLASMHGQIKAFKTRIYTASTAVSLKQFWIQPRMVWLDLSLWQTSDPADFDRLAPLVIDEARVVRHYFGKNVIFRPRGDDASVRKILEIASRRDAADLFVSPEGRPPDGFKDAAESHLWNVAKPMSIVEDVKYRNIGARPVIREKVSGESDDIRLPVIRLQLWIAAFVAGLEPGTNEETEFLTFFNAVSGHSAGIEDLRLLLLGDKDTLIRFALPTLPAVPLTEMLRVLGMAARLARQSV